MPPSVSIVIVTWNKRTDVLNLLDSLQAIDTSNVSIIIVDNASTDGSAEAISNHPLSVTLIENSENLGGTGGFNTGIRYALNKFEQKYIWLLDNDAEVNPETLEKLIAAMEIDTSIGIAGSCILNPEDHAQIVEAGGYLDQRTATWKPNLRYQPYSNYKGSPPIDVDYVPACSALVRKKLFEVSGMLDERFFLHWDDVDLGKVAIEKGFRVVAVLDSTVFHGTEKGYSNAVLYYDVRNSLLFITKHFSIVKRILPMFRVCFRSLLAARLFKALGELPLSWYLYQAVENYTSGRFGAAPLPPPHVNNSVEADALSLDAISTFKNIVVFAVGSSAEIISTVKLIHSVAPSASVTLAAPSERIDSYRSCALISHFISYELARGSIGRMAAVGVKLLRSQYDCAISAGAGFVVPFAFLVPRHFVSTDNGRKIVVSKARLDSLWKLPFLILAGFIISIFITTKCWLVSRRISA